MVKKVSYYIGLSDKEGNKLTDKQTSELFARLNKHLQGYTIHEAHGAWKGTYERSLIIEVLLFEELDLKALEQDLIEWLKETNQEAIMKTVEQVKASFLEA